MPQRPLVGDVHVNKPLTNVSIAFIQEQSNFVADRAFPNIPVPNMSDVYYRFPRDYFNRDEMEERADGTESAGGSYIVNTDSYRAIVYAFHHDIGDQRRSNSDNMLDPDREATILCTTKALIKKESLWVSKNFTTGVWATDRVGVAAGPTGTQFLQWDQDSSDPIKDIWDGKATMLESTGFEPNKLVLGYRVFKRLIQHPDIVDRVKYGQLPGSPAMVSEAELAALFKVPEVLVMRAIRNTAAENQTASHSFIGGNNALLLYGAPAPGLMLPSAGYHFSWTGYLGASPMGHRIKQFRVEERASDRVEVEMAFDQKVVASELGLFFSSAVAS